MFLNTVIYETPDTKRSPNDRYHFAGNIPLHHSKKLALVARIIARRSIKGSQTRLMRGSALSVLTVRTLRVGRPQGNPGCKIWFNARNDSQRPEYVEWKVRKTRCSHISCYAVSCRNMLRSQELRVIITFACFTGKRMAIVF